LDALAVINEYLHDAKYSLDDVAYDETKRSVSIPFHWDPNLRGKSVFRRRRQNASDYIWRDRIFRDLTVFNVDGIELDDPAGLIEHSYSRLSYDDGTLTLLSNFPGRIQMMVSKVEVKLVERDLE